MTIDQIKSTFTPTEIAALTTFGEAAGEPVEGQIAILHVLRNRARYRAVPVSTIALEKFQFSCWWEGGPNTMRVYDRANKLAAGKIDDVIYEQIAALSPLVLTGTVLDNTGNATFYLTKALYASNPPSWTVGQSPHLVIGNHLFFRNIPPYAKPQPIIA